MKYEAGLISARNALREHGHEHHAQCVQTLLDRLLERAPDRPDSATLREADQRLRDEGFIREAVLLCRAHVASEL